MPAVGPDLYRRSFCCAALGVLFVGLGAARRDMKPMRLDAYPPQEPLPEIAREFHEKMMALGEGVEGHEHSFGDDPSQSLMVFPCSQPNSPVLLFMHGGGWTNGYKEQMAFLAPPLNAEGFTLVSSSYRLAPKYVFPANFDDVADAVAMTWKLAGTYGYDRDAVFIGGHSAGGHLASLLAVKSDWQGQRGLPENVIKGCLPISATLDFTPAAGGSVRPRFLGPEGVFNEVKASPLFQLGERLPPFLVAYGTQDIPHLPGQAQKFAMVARSKGGELEVLEIDGASHIDAMLWAADPAKPWLPAAVKWMRSVL